MAERPKQTKPVDMFGFFNENVNFSFTTPELPEERASRLRREEAEAEHTLRSQTTEDVHKRRISLTLHIFVMSIVALAFLASAYIAVAVDPKSGLPDKAMGIITAIVAAAVGYMTGKGSK